LRVKLAVIYIVICIISLVLFSLVIYNSLESSFLNERSKELLRKANITAVHIEKNKYLYNTNFVQFSADLEQTSLESEARIVVCDLNAVVINDSSNKDIGKIFVMPQVLKALDGKDSTEVQDKKVVISVPIKGENDKVIGVVYAKDESTSLSNITESISTRIIVVSVIICILMSIMIYFVTSFIVTPLKRMLKVIDKMAEGKFDEKVKVSGHDELSELSMAFNQMSAKLQKIDSNRHEFVSNVSHELKTPLSSMKVLLESLLLQDNVPQEMYKEFLEDTNSEIDRLTEIINHLLTLVKLDIKVLPLSLENININQMIDGIIKRLKPLADKKGLEVKFTTEKENVIAEIDKINITLAISNLVENSIKYTDEGSVEVILDADHQNMYISVIDTGIGMAQEDQAKVFDRFYRVDKTRDRQTGGTGLGLAITHRAIILHGGSIKLSSEEGKGTTFVVRIPLKQNNK